MSHVTHMIESCHTHVTHSNTLKHTATHCNTLQHTATLNNTVQYSATHCNTLQHTATHCNALQHTATHLLLIINHGVDQRIQHGTLQHSATHYRHSAIQCKTLHIAALHCDTVQQTATQCNRLQHICCSLSIVVQIKEYNMTHCNTLQTL